VTPLEAALLALSATLAAVWGAALLGGLPWGLLTYAAVSAAWTVLLYDPQKRRRWRRRVRRTREGGFARDDL
jgi:4-hydroxybenzoate polyprenyltransferase